MVSQDDLERIDKVVDEIADLQTHLKNNVEAQDTKLEKYDKIVCEMVNAKIELEAKILSLNTNIHEFEKRSKEMMKVMSDLFNKSQSNEAKNNLDDTLEYNNEKLDRLETYIHAKETKIAELESKLEVFQDISCMNEQTLNEDGGSCECRNINNKRTHLSDDCELLPKRIKLNKAANSSLVKAGSNVERILNILTLSGNLKEFFLPLLTSDSEWNLNMSYIPDFTDIEKTEDNLLMDSIVGSVIYGDPIESGNPAKVKVYQNPNDKRFVRLELDCEQEYIYAYDNDTNMVIPGLHRFNNKTRELPYNSLGFRSFKGREGCKEDKNYALVQYHHSGCIYYHEQTVEDGKWKDLARYKFIPNTLTWKKELLLMQMFVDMLQHDPEMVPHVSGMIQQGPRIMPQVPGVMPNAPEMISYVPGILHDGPEMMTQNTQFIPQNNEIFPAVQEKLIMECTMMPDNSVIMNPALENLQNGLEILKMGPEIMHQGTEILQDDQEVSQGGSSSEIPSYSVPEYAPTTISNFTSVPHCPTYLQTDDQVSEYETWLEKQKYEFIHQLKYQDSEISKIVKSIKKKKKRKTPADENNLQRVRTQISDLQKVVVDLKRQLHQHSVKIYYHKQTKI